MIRTIANSIRRPLFPTRHQPLSTISTSIAVIPTSQRQGRSYVQEARTKAIVVQDYQGKLFAGEVITVKAGYMRNELYPRKVCVYATEENMKKLEQEMTEEKYKELEDKKRGARVIRFFRRESEGLEMKRTTTEQPLRQPGGNAYIDLVYMLENPITRREVYERVISAFPDVADTLDVNSIEIPETMHLDRTGSYLVPIRVSENDVFEMPIHVARQIKSSTRDTLPTSKEDEEKARGQGLRAMTEEEKKEANDELMSYMRMTDAELSRGMEEAKRDLEVMEKLKKGMTVDEVVRSMRKPRRKRQKQADHEQGKKDQELLKSADLKTD